MPKRLGSKQEFIKLTEPVNTVEVVAKPKPTREELETIEIPIKKKAPASKRLPKTTDRTTKQKELTGKSVLIITEKPQASAKIASALSGGRARQLSGGGVPYYEFEKEGKNVIVACAVGHLFSISQDVKGSNYPIFDVSWKPNSEVRKKDFTKKYYQNIARLIRQAGEIVVASVDYNESTPIIEKGDMKIVKIGELVDEIINKKKQISDFLIPAFNSKGKINFVKLKQAIRHPAHEDLYELSLEYGRKVKLTSSHNIFTLDKNKIEMIKTTDLKIGDRILCPKKLPIIEKTNINLNLLDLKNYNNTRDVFVGGEDVAKILKNRILKRSRKDHFLNDKRVILTKEGAETLKKMRIKNKFSTSQIAEKVRISQSLICLWENRMRNPSKNKLTPYLLALGIKTEEFIRNPRYCAIKESSFQNLLSTVYKTQHKNFSNFTRAIIKLEDLEDHEIKTIKNAYIYGSKNKRNKLPVNLKMDSKLARLMGYFLAEGDINQDYRMRFSLGLKDYGNEQKIIDEISEFCKIYDINYNYYLHKKIKHQIITIDNCILSSLFKNIFKFGHGARNKRIPTMIFSLPLDLKKEFLRAYFLGDGSLRKTNMSFNTSSELLAKDLSYLLLQFGILSSTSIVKKSGMSNKPFWHISISKRENLIKIKDIWQDHHKRNNFKLATNSKKNSYIEFGDLALLKIKDIKMVKPSTKYVYDLSVEGENFIAGDGGVCCHNTDYDTEGEVIGYNIIRFIAHQKDAKRMKFSSLTTKELEEAYIHQEPTINWGQAIAGETRHYLDWFYGINLSRALMNSIKSVGKFKIMSIGRVQGPALNLIVKKEAEINAFKSEPFWRVLLNIKDKTGNKLEVKYIKDIKDKEILPDFEKLKDKECDVNTKKTLQTLLPPPPFDLTTLQTESYKFFGITPSKTLQIAQQLYLAGIISYPRTSSQKIPESIEPKKILKRLSEIFKEADIATRNQPIEGKKSDPAHPSIYPTGEFQELSGEDKKIYELIAKRFISCFSPDAKTENKVITAEIDNKKFKAYGLEIKEKGWMSVYPIKIQEKEVRDMNGKAKIEEVKIEEDVTKPPRRFSPASIISELEARGLGTKATRANILETLYDRGYITDNKAIKATQLGISLINSLDKHSPVIINEDLTREIEKETEKMQEGVDPEKLNKKQDAVLTKAKSLIKKISEDFHKQEKEIGKELVEATQEVWKQEAEANKLNPCPVCKSGSLAIKYSPRYKKSFIACNAYPDCKTTFSLPPGMIKNPKKPCPKCNFPLLMRLKKGKRPWIFCFNPNCPSRQETVQKEPEENQEDQNEEESGDNNEESLKE